MPTAPIRTYNPNCLQPLMGRSEAHEVNVRLTASKVYPIGARLKETATRGTYDLWDGTGNWQLLNKYACNTDATGNITLVGQSGVVGDEFGGFSQYATGYYQGAFDTKDLTAFDAAALTGSPAGTSLISGTAVDGVIVLR